MSDFDKSIALAESGVYVRPKPGEKVDKIKDPEPLAYQYRNNQGTQNKGFESFDLAQSSAYQPSKEQNRPLQYASDVKIAESTTYQPPKNPNVIEAPKTAESEAYKPSYYQYQNNQGTQNKGFESFDLAQSSVYQPSKEQNRPLQYTSDVKKSECLPNQFPENVKIQGISAVKVAESTAYQPNNQVNFNQKGVEEVKVAESTAYQPYQNRHPNVAEAPKTAESEAYKPSYYQYQNNQGTQNKGFESFDLTQSSVYQPSKEQNRPLQYASNEKIAESTAYQLRQNVKIQEISAVKVAESTSYQPNNQVNFNQKGVEEVKVAESTAYQPYQNRRPNVAEAPKIAETEVYQSSRDPKQSINELNLAESDNYFQPTKDLNANIRESTHSPGRFRGRAPESNQTEKLAESSEYVPAKKFAPVVESPIYKSPPQESKVAESTVYHPSSDEREKSAKTGSLDDINIFHKHPEKYSPNVEDPYNSNIAESGFYQPPSNRGSLKHIEYPAESPVRSLFHHKSTSLSIADFHLTNSGVYNGPRLSAGIKDLNDIESVISSMTNIDMSPNSRPGYLVKLVNFTIKNYEVTLSMQDGHLIIEAYEINLKKFFASILDNQTVEKISNCNFTTIEEIKDLFIDAAGGEFPDLGLNITENLEIQVWCRTTIGSYARIHALITIGLKEEEMGPIDIGERLLEKAYKKKCELSEFDLYLLRLLEKVVAQGKALELKVNTVDHVLNLICAKLRK